jgi:hypothetical protein
MSTMALIKVASIPLDAHAAVMLPLNTMPASRIVTSLFISALAAVA